MKDAQLRHINHIITKLTQCGRDKVADISQTTFSHVFSRIKIICISINISLKVVPNGPINNSIDNIPALVQIKAWRQQSIIWSNGG